MNKDDCKFELPEGWYEDTVYTNWVKVLTKRIEESLISEFVNDLKEIITELDCMARTKASRKIEKWDERSK